MKVELYGIRDGSKDKGKWQWRTTLDFETDRQMVLAQVDNQASMIRLMPGVSVGQAILLSKRLNRLSQNQDQVTLDQIRREIINGCLAAGMDQKTISLIQLVCSQLHSPASTSSRAPLNNRVLDQLIRILAGRSLLSEELLGLMDPAGLGEWKGEWPRYVQAGICLGLLEVASGMEVTVRQGWLKGERIHAECRRCGTTGERERASRVGHVLRRWTGADGGGEKTRHVKAAAVAGGDSRDGGIHWTFCRECGSLCPYCEACLTMGRVKHCSLLIRGVGGRELPMQIAQGQRPDAVSMTAVARDASSSRPQIMEDQLSPWGLSPAQTAAAAEGLGFLKQTAPAGGSLRTGEDSGFSPPRFLIWAVTGAGKTEMIFPLVEYELQAGRQVLLATPRKDVVLELAPRLAKAFVGRKVVALYGGSGDRWEQGDLTLATTHQLMRFYQAFDLVIIDELDAFPYHNNPMLIHAARQVCTVGGRYVLLSATPPLSLQREVGRGKLPHVRVPVRYHRRPLPVPVRLAAPPPEQILKRGRLPGNLMRALGASVTRRAQIFVFVPKISLVEPLVRLLARAFPDAVVRGTSSKDGERGEKVTDFRGRTFNILVTTTILERGVTVPKSDVFIIGADARLFDAASLVQMAGRAGRSKDDPYGRVYFVSREWTVSQVTAVREIRTMNKLAKDKGYLLD